MSTETNGVVPDLATDPIGGHPVPLKAEGSESWLRRRAVVANNVLLPLLLIVLPLTVYTILLLRSNDNGGFAVDFQSTLLPAAEKLSHGVSPYPAYGYPPLVAFSLVPFAFLPHASVFFIGLLVLSVPASLWLLGVRDWRCYGVAFLWAPTFHAVQTANVSILLLLGFALCWRFRESPAGVTIAGGLTIAAKIICWPIVLWLVATRRYRGALGAFVVSIVITFGLWGTLGFSGLMRYPSNLDRLSAEVSPDSYTLKALASDLGLRAAVGTTLGLLLVIVLCVLCLTSGRRHDDRLSFALAVLIAIVASPIVWMHSFVLLLAVVALFRPRLSVVWVLPVVLWLGSGNGNGEPWQTALVLGVSGAVFAACVLGGDRDGARVDSSSG